jgi:hypothetical protein
MGCGRLRELYARNGEMDEITPWRTRSHIVLQRFALKIKPAYFKKAPQSGAFLKICWLFC